MSEPQQPPPANPPLRWPKFAIAFVLLGAILWVAWMVKFIHQTRMNKTDDFFVPMNTNPLPVNAAPPGLYPEKPPQTSTNK